jgi:queuine tRNA-ribosyltransferase
MFSFHLHHTDAATAARRATFVTPHGAVEMPAFMPVGTLATVKGLEIEQLRGTGAQMVLANTYHLTLRPGEQVVAALGGLHAFMGWDGPILTDSGGFQIFSLGHMTKVTEQDAVFRSHIDGRLLAISPERAVAIQEALGSDIAMVLDHVVELPNDAAVVRDACERSIRWADRCRRAARRSDQAQFAIVQGGLDADLRCECAEALARLDFPGYAVGGLSVGEPPAEMYRILDATVPHLPADRPRYLMGVGRPEDLLEAVARGIDLFDCVMPTRNGRNAMAFTDAGPIRLRNLKYESDPRPLQVGCPCPACRRSRAYIRHLFMAGEMLGPILLSIHNLTYYQHLLAGARQAIVEDRFAAYRAEKLAGWTGMKDERRRP